MPVALPSIRQPARTAIAVGVTAALLAVTAAGALAGPQTSGPLLVAETLSARISGGILALVARLPLGYAILAGMVAAFNPCGFVLLPAYLGLYLRGDRDAAGPGGLTRRAITISLVLTASFVLLFGAAGILAGLAASALTTALPWIGTAVGACLILAGGALASGRQLNSSLPPRAARRLRRAALAGGSGGFAAYGVAYGLASLGCALPVFLAVVATSFQLHGLAAAVGQFMLYGLGMGIVVTALTTATAFLGQRPTHRLRSIARHTQWVSAILVWLAGGYVMYYWLTAIRLL